MIPVVDPTHLVNIYLSSDFSEFIFHGPLHEWSASYFAMPGQNSKCSSCGKLKETALIEYSSCEQWLSHPAGPGCQQMTMLLSLNQHPFTSVNACQPTGKYSNSQDPTQCFHCHRQTGSRRKTIQCSECNRPFHLSYVKISGQHYFLLHTNTCGPILNHNIFDEPHPRALSWLITLHLAPIAYSIPKTRQSP